MSREHFDNECQGCRPVVLDPDTMQRYPADSPLMRLVNRLWNELGRADREAFHRFTCLNSRDPADVATMRRFCERIEREAKT